MSAGRLVVALACVAGVSCAGASVDSTPQPPADERPSAAGRPVADADVESRPADAALADAAIADGGADTAATASRVAISATGDLVLSPRVIRAWRTLGDDGLRRMLGGYQRLVHADDIAYINLETMLVNDVNPLLEGGPGRPPILGAPPGVAETLAAVGVDIVSLANNHAYDQADLGLERTIAILEANGIDHAGAGPSAAAAYAPRIVERGGLRVAFLSATSIMNIRAERGGPRRHYVARLWDEPRVVEAIAAAREVSDVVVLCLHWSRDFERRATRVQRRIARRLVRAGADVILGTGPHVLHEVERFESERGEAVVAYCLGNLLTNMAFRYRAGRRAAGFSHPSNVLPEARDGVVMRLVLHVERDDGDAGARPRIVVESLTAVPLWTLNNYSEHERTGVPLAISVVPLAEAAPAVIEERRPLIAEALGEAVDLQ